MAERKRVFVIDDDQFVLTMVLRLVETFGYAASGAHDGEQALEMLSGMQPPPDVIITDIVMPKKDGLETLKELRQMFPAMHIIAVSGGGRTDQGDYLDLARAAGASEIISKPIDPRQLKAILHQMTEPTTGNTSHADR